MRLGAGALAATLMSIALVAMPDPDDVDAAGRYRVRRERVAPGLTLLRIRDSRGPNRIRVLKLAPTSPLTTEMELANDQIPGHETTSSMAARNGAVAAINGDFTLLPGTRGAGRPVHTFAQNGRLVTTPLVYGRNFAQRPDESAVFIGHPNEARWLTQTSSGERWPVGAWNERPIEWGEYSVFTQEGGWNHAPPPDACSARLMPTGSPVFTGGQKAITQSFTVAAVKCAADRLILAGGTVIAAPWGSIEGTKIQTQLSIGEPVSLTWTTGWRGIDETIGGNPTLIENGRISEGGCSGSYFCYRNPRTGIGVTEGGTILMVTVDGRQKRSVGMTPVQFARLFRYLGATWALNLDGGGSTTMWVRGDIVNKPSGSRERPVGSAVLLVPQPVPTPTPTPTSTTTPSPDPSATAAGRGEGPVRSLAGAEASHGGAGCAWLRDPASTGGLADLIDQTARRGLPPGLTRALAVYRGERACPGRSESAPRR